MSIPFTQMTFVNDSATVPVSAQNLNDLEAAVKTLCDGGSGSGVDSDTVRGKNLVAPLEITKGLEGHWSFADLPEAPDESPTLFEREWATAVTNWTSHDSSATLAGDINHLTLTHAGFEPTISRTISVPASSTVKVKILDTGNISGVSWYEGSSYLPMTLVEKNDYLIGTIQASAIATIVRIRVTTTNTSPVYIKWIYVGTGNYLSRAIDSYMMKKNGVAYGVTPSSRGNSLLSLYFDRVNDRVVLPLPNLTRKTAIAISLRVESQLASNEAGTVFTLGNYGTTGFALRTTTNNNYFIEWYGGAGGLQTSSGLGLTLGTTPTHLVLSYVIATRVWSLYVNGVLLTSGTLAQAIAVPNSGTLELGAYNGSDFFKGYIADVSVYSRSVSLQEAWELYQNPEDLDQASLSSVFVRGAVPQSATSAGEPGMVVMDSGYLYVCTAPNTWRRATLATW